MFFVNHSDVVGFLLLMFHEILPVFFPDMGLHFIDFLLLNLQLLFFFHLFVEEFSHFQFLKSDLFFFSFFFLVFSIVLFDDVSHHFLILFSDDLFLVFNDAIGEGGHDSLDFVFSVFFFEFSLFLHFY